MNWSTSVSGANETRGQVQNSRLDRRCLGASVALVVACGGMQSPAFAATESIGIGAITTTTAMDPPQSGRIPAVIVGPGKPTTRIPAGNPLWAVPLRVLTETRDRPLFSPSRRPPPAAVIAAPIVAPRPQPPAAPDHPPLTLVGTVVGGRQAIGVFVDEASKSIVRLRIGQNHDGWILRAVHERDAVFDDRRREAILALPAVSGKNRPANLAVNPAQALPAGAWMDGDGQQVSPPKLTTGSATQPYVHPAAATWVDGDGQLVPPPPVRY